MFGANLHVQSPSAFDFRLDPRKGLMVDVGGVPVIRGSYIQFFKPDWSKGYYSTVNDRPTIKRVDLNTVNLTFLSEDHRASGTVTYHRDFDRLAVHYDLNWDSDESANIEVASGLIWAPAFERGQLTAAGNPTRPLDRYSYAGEGIGNRRFSPDSSSYDWTGPLGVLSEKSSVDLTLFDARGYDQDWAVGHQYLWLGSLGIPIAKGKRVSFDVHYRIDVTSTNLGEIANLDLAPKPDPTALLPDDSKAPLIPKPQSARLDWAHPLEYSGFKFPIGEFDHLDEFNQALSRRFRVPTPDPKKKRIAFDGGISKLGMVPGGYRLTITEDSISVLGEEDEGLRNGLYRLAAIAFISGGKLCFPTGTIVDQPKTDWRGVHLFVGKQAYPFQSKLWTKVLRPLGFNKVVLQCERTNWDCLPKIVTAMTMAKPDLIKLFAFYRRIGVDPIPLVQSYGHMEWLFANNQNLDLAMNPKVPYAINPENPKSAELMNTLWAEIIGSLHPDVVHFGLDEVDMRGVPEDPPRETTLWEEQVGFLGSIAKANHVKMMLWGDQGLAPSEAPDATNGDTMKDAAARRDAIPRGSLIGDWHYVGDSAPSRYRQTLQTWKDAGLNPIASAWYNPNNIAGFDTEAGALGCGTLQTTWCGYESNEQGMLEAFNQFTAMVLAADYSWSGRREKPADLDYDPAQVFRKMYFGEPSPLVPAAGIQVGFPAAPFTPFTVGRIHYGNPVSIPLATVLINGQGGHGSALLKFNATASRLELACNTVFAADEDGERVADVLVKFADGTSKLKPLVYGMDIRSMEDKRGLPLADRSADGVCSIDLDLGPKPVAITGILVNMASKYTGLTLKGVELTR